MSVFKKLFDLLSPREKTFVSFVSYDFNNGNFGYDRCSVNFTLHWIIDQPRASRNKYNFN